MSNRDEQQFLFEVPKAEGGTKKLKIPLPKSAVEEARQFGGWTVSKLQLLDFYFRLYRRVAGNGSYIDGFAGTGSIRVGDQTEERPGSVAIALGSEAFKNLFLYERPRNAVRLRRYLEEHFEAKDVARCRIRSGDFNELILEDMANGVIPRDRPCFAFLDPNATDLSWATVEALSQYKGGEGGEVLKIELFVLLNTHQALMRLLPTKFKPSYATSPQAATVDRVMGDRSAWWDIYERGGSAGELANRYAERLHRKLGYGAALPYRILDPVTKSPQYYMIHASDHPAAFNFMRWAERESGRERLETPRLFSS